MTPEKTPKKTCCSKPRGGTVVRLEEGARDGPLARGQFRPMASPQRVCEILNRPLGFGALALRHAELVGDLPFLRTAGRT